MGKEVIYLETSALLRWLFGENSHARVEKVLNSAKNVCTSIITVMEARRVIQRAAAVGELSTVDARVTLNTLLQAAPAWTMISISEDVQFGMSQTFAREPVRTLDAIHLITAKLCSQAMSPLRVLSFDERILKNLSGLGLKPC